MSETIPVTVDGPIVWAEHPYWKHMRCSVTTISKQPDPKGTWYNYTVGGKKILFTLQVRFGAEKGLPDFVDGCVHLRDDQGEYDCSYVGDSCVHRNTKPADDAAFWDKHKFSDPNAPPVEFWNALGSAFWEIHDGILKEVRTLRADQHMAAMAIRPGAA